MEETEKTHQLYYCVIPQRNSQTEKVWVMADEVGVDKYNNLLFKNGGSLTFMLNALEWRQVYASSCFTGDPVKEIDHRDMKSSPKEEEVFISKRKKRKRIRDKDLEDLSE